MPTITIRQVSDQAYQDLKAQAERHGRSMEAEARDLIVSGTQSRNWLARWIEETKEWRGPDLPIPSRSMPRDLELDVQT